ncbi:MAG: MFS transporter, partial [Chloroflexi bacterium]|nr:MFS transporter [Chloroflexota bacterium]
IGMTFFNAIFGMAYIILLPVFAKDILQVGASGLGYLYAASGTGALLGTLAMAFLTRVRYKGWLLLGGATFFGSFLILFAVTSQVLASVPIALLLLFLAGLSTSLYMVSIMTTLQSLVPDALRGRVMGIYGMTWSLVPVGAMLSGAIAEAAGAPFAVGLGGAAVIVYAVAMAVLSRQVRSLGGQAPS